MRKWRYRGQCRASADTPGAIDVSPMGRGAWRRFEWFGPVCDTEEECRQWYHRTYGERSPLDLSFIKGNKPSWSVCQYHQEEDDAMSKITQCYADSKGTVHPTYEAAVASQKKIDEYDPAKEVHDAFMLLKRDAVRDKFRASSRFGAPVTVSDKERLDLLISALQATGYKLVKA